MTAVTSPILNFTAATATAAAAATLPVGNISGFAGHAHKSSLGQDTCRQAPAIHAARVDTHGVVHQLQTTFGVVPEEHRVRA